MTFKKRTGRIFLLLIIVIVASILYLASCLCVLCSSSLQQTFANPMTSEDTAMLRRTVEALARALDRINATYFMASGTLLGSYRHHGRIPWDDDADLMVDKAEKHRVYAALMELAPEYVVYLTDKV